MQLGEVLRIALNAIFINKLRAALTTLGIIIGVGAVIGLISLGRGVQNYIRAEFESIGANMLIVFASEPASKTRTRIEPITTLDMAALSDPEVAPSLRYVGAEVVVPGFIIANGESRSATITGVTPNMRLIKSWEPAHGEYIRQEHLDNSERVALMTVDLLEDLYGDPDYDATGEVVRVNGVTFTIIGTMEHRGVPIGSDNSSLIVPLTTAASKMSDARIGGGYRLSIMYAQAWSDEVAADAEREIDQYFYEAHNIQFDGEQDYTIVNRSTFLDALNAITGLLTVFLGMIAGVSLLVGGIGIMNIMLVSVTERTREIGLRKAVGAKNWDILSQFLTEAVVLSAIGGVIGILMGWGITLLGNFFVPALQMSLTLDAVLLATIVTTLIGIIFGMLPAVRAARMPPIDALRFE